MAFNLSSTGLMRVGRGIEGIATPTTASIYQKLGVYANSADFVKIISTAGAPAGLVWHSASNQNFEFNFSQGLISSSTRVFSISPNGQAAVGNIPINPNFDFNIDNGLVVNQGYVGIGTDNPETTLHIVDQHPNPDEQGVTNQVHGLLIENQGSFNHDYALQVNTGHGKIFTVGNAGVVHIGNGLNWAIPDHLDYMLYVQNGIRTERVRVDVANQNGWADYVFEEGYELMPIEELEAYIKEHKHLPGVPSAEEVVEEGIDLAEMNKILLEKIEELTLRVIELEKEAKK